MSYDIATIRQKHDDELATLLAEECGRLEDLRFRQAARELKGAHEIREARRAIARMRTVLRERQTLVRPTPQVRA